MTEQPSWKVCALAVARGADATERKRKADLDAPWAREAQAALAEFAIKADVVPGTRDVIADGVVFRMVEAIQGQKQLVIVETCPYCHSEVLSYRIDSWTTLGRALRGDFWESHDCPVERAAMCAASRRTGKGV